MAGCDSQPENACSPAPARPGRNFLAPVQQLAGVLLNALNAAAVPMPADSGGECPTDASTEYDGDGYNERPLDRG